MIGFVANTLEALKDVIPFAESSLASRPLNLVDNLGEEFHRQFRDVDSVSPAEPMAKLETSNSVFALRVRL